MRAKQVVFIVRFRALRRGARWETILVDDSPVTAQLLATLRAQGAEIESDLAKGALGG